MVFTWQCKALLLFGTIYMQLNLIENVINLTFNLVISPAIAHIHAVLLLLASTNYNNNASSIWEQTSSDVHPAK